MKNIFTPKSCLMVLFGIFISNLTLAQEVEETKPRKVKTPVVYPRHKITTDLFAPFSRSLLFNYELLLPNQKMAVRVPLGFQFTDESARYFLGRIGGFPEDLGEEPAYPYISSYYKREVGIHSGVSMLFYLNPPKRFRPYLAPELMTGLFFRKYKNSLTNKVDSTYVHTPLANTTKYTLVLGGGLNFGVQGISKRNFSYGIEAGLGLGGKVFSGFSYDLLFYRKISFHFGYHFGEKKRAETE